MADKILFTGGHLTPALAVLAAMQSNNNVVWVGHKYAQTGNNQISDEYKAITAINIPFYGFKAGKIWRKWTLQALKPAVINTALIPVGFVKALWLMARLRPKLVVSFGGYLALPIVISAKLFGCKVITHEQTVVPGLANKLIAKYADKVLISWQHTATQFAANKTVFTGNPIRTSVLTNTTSNYNFKRNLPLLYITGGNQGANNINRRILPILPDLLTIFNIIHQTGNSTISHDHEKALTAKQLLPPDLQSSYIVHDSIFGPEIGEIFAKASLVIGRSGANTACEILATGKMAILMPIPWTSGDEQTKNAQMVADTGLGLLIRQKDELTPADILQAVQTAHSHLQNSTGFNGQPIADCRAKAAKLIKLDAAQNIAKQIEQLMAP